MANNNNNNNIKLINNHVLFGELKKALANNTRYRSLYSASNSWLRDNINKLLDKNKKISGISPYSFVNNSTPASSPEPGNLYMFLYDAKTKERLPYWDKFPIALYIQPADGGFLGINFHYLSPMVRASLFDELLSVASVNEINKNTKMKLTYSVIDNFSRKNNLIKFCLKRYLIQYFRSNVILIEPADWKLALFLPFETFQKASAQDVWKDSGSYKRKQ